MMERLASFLQAALPYDPWEHFRQNKCGKGHPVQIVMHTLHTANI